MSVLVIGQHYWGYADTLAGAKRNFKLEGGQLSKGYMIFEFPDELEFTGVDMIGQVHWTREPEHADIQPKMIEVKSR